MAISQKQINIDLSLKPNFFHGTSFGDNKKAYKDLIIPFSQVRKEQDLRDVAYKITDDEIKAIQKEIEHVVRWSEVSSQFLPSRTISKGLIKDSYWQWKDIPAPRLTRDFGIGPKVITAKEETVVEFMGMDYDYHFTMPEVDLASATGQVTRFNESLIDGTRAEIINSLTQYREYYIGFGTATVGLEPDLGFTGLYNDPNITTIAQYSTDDDLQAAGDVLEAVKMHAKSLIGNKYQPPFTLQMSPAVLIQAITNEETTVGLGTDMARIQKMQLPNGTPLFNKFIMNPYITLAAETGTDDGVICCMAEQSTTSRTNFELVETYPMGFYPLPAVDLGITGKYLWMGGVEIPHPDSITIRNEYVTGGL